MDQASRKQRKSLHWPHVLIYSDYYYPNMYDTINARSIPTTSYHTYLASILVMFSRGVSVQKRLVIWICLLLFSQRTAWTARRTSAETGLHSWHWHFHRLSFGPHHRCPFQDQLHWTGNSGTDLHTLGQLYVQGHTEYPAELGTAGFFTALSGTHRIACHTHNIGYAQHWTGQTQRLISDWPRVLA